MSLGGGSPSDTLLLVDCRRAAHQYAPAAAFVRLAHCLVYHRRRRQKERTGDSSLRYFLRRRVSHLRSATSCIDPERGACSCCSRRPTGKPLATSPQLLFPLRRPPAACRRRRPSVPSSAMRTYGAPSRQETTMRGGGTRRLTAVISGRRHRGRCRARVQSQVFCLVTVPDTAVTKRMRGRPPIDLA